MTAKKSFLIVLRVVFSLFLLQFIKDAFYKWDGYSYYMRFIDLLPDLSLAFVLLTITTVIFVFATWLIAYIIYKITPKSILTIRFEHITLWLVIGVFILFIKNFFFSHSSQKNFIDINQFMILLIGGILVAVVVWSLRVYIEKMLNELNSHITPLVWLFVVLLILAMPFSVSSIYKKEIPTAKYIAGSNLSSDKKQPNVILITLDALTALDMQVYGYEHPTTPFISKWARDAIVFKKAYSSSNWTVPGAMSLMTGQREWTHRVWYQAFSSPVRGYSNNLPKVLRDNGYNVYGFIQNAFAHPDTLGIGESFVTKDCASTFEILPDRWGIKSLIIFLRNRPIVNDFLKTTSPIIDSRSSINTLLQMKKPAQKINEPGKTSVIPDLLYNSFLNYVSQIQQENKPHNPGQPFFAWLHLMPPHSPYLPPKPYFGMFGNAEKFISTEEQEKFLLREYKPEEQAEIDILRRRYDEFILYSDKQFESFLSRLDDVIDMSNTILILSSDHGESFSHGYQAHGGDHLYEPLVHIPLIIKLPGYTKGKAIDMSVELIDVAPTILELTNIPVPSWMEGRSLLPLLEGKTLEPRPVFSTHFIKNRSFGHSISNGTIAVWDGDYKLIYYLEDGKSLLYNLKVDPGEVQNIIHKKPDITKSLMTLIDKNLSRANARITQYKK